MGGGAAGEPQRHQTWSPSWSPCWIQPRFSSQVKTERIDFFVPDLYKL